MNKRFLTVLGLAALLALVVSGIFYQVTTSAGRPRRGKVETKEVVVTTAPVALGVVIKAGDLKMVAWPVDNIPPGAFHKIDEVVDRVAISNLLVDEPVLAGRLAMKGSGLGLSPSIPPGMRAVSVRVNDVIAVAGFVLPGSRVDVLVSGVPRGPEALAGPVTRTILSNIQVLSAGANIQPDAKGAAQNVAVVTLLVTPQQGEILTLASGEGRIQLALRNNTDLEPSAGGGARSNELFGGVAKTAPEAKPRPRPVTVKLAPPAPQAAPPPPPQIEMIRADKKSVEVIPAIYR
ncbi:MAG: Flp pilus assembly protein CpaB [Acidobacteria bacterium]|nr:Flp pilus assembly protein CpaB [Acidobacteriota bacterium]